MNLCLLFKYFISNSVNVFTLWFSNYLSTIISPSNKQWQIIKIHCSDFFFLFWNIHWVGGQESKNWWSLSGLPFPRVFQWFFNFKVVLSVMIPIKKRILTYSMKNGTVKGFHDMRFNLFFFFFLLCFRLNRTMVILFPLLPVCILKYWMKTIRVHISQCPVIKAIFWNLLQWEQLFLTVWI